MAKSKYQLTRRKTNVVGRFVCLDNTSGDLVIWFLVGSTVMGSFWVKIGKINSHAWARLHKTPVTTTGTRTCTRNLSQLH